MEGEKGNYERERESALKKDIKGGRDKDGLKATSRKENTGVTKGKNMKKKRKNVRLEGENIKKNYRQKETAKRKRGKK